MMAQKKAIVTFIEYCGKHPFATGLFALLSLLGLGVGLFGFSLDRRDAAKSSQLSREIQASVEEIAKSNSSLHFGYVDELDRGDTRERVINSLGDPKWRRKIQAEVQPNTYEEQVIEVFVIEERMTRIIFDELDSVQDYCITVLAPGTTYSTHDGVTIGQDTFAELYLKDVPMHALLDQSNYRGSYRYEETGDAPSVTGARKWCCFSFHGIQDFLGAKKLNSTLLPTQYASEDKLNLRMPDSYHAVDGEYYFNSTGVTFRYGESEPTFQPASFHSKFLDFRRNHIPDTYCSGGAIQLRDANSDLEKQFSNFQEYLRAT